MGWDWEWEMATEEEGEGEGEWEWEWECKERGVLTYMQYGRNFACLCTKRIKRWTIIY